MADTLRTKTELLALFADGQIDGSITPQDMRDLIETLTPAIGSIYFSGLVETAITTVNVKVLASGNTTLVTQAHDVDMPQNNRIRYIGTKPRHFEVSISMSTTTAANNKNIEYQIFKNGIALTETTMQIKHGTGNDFSSVSITTNVILSLNDYIELFISNETDNTNVTIENGTINLLGFIVE